MEEPITVIQINCVNDNIFYTRNINYLDEGIVFIDYTGGNRSKRNLTYSSISSTSIKKVEISILFN